MAAIIDAPRIFVLDEMSEEKPESVEVERDPLTYEQKRKIKALVDECLLKTQTEEIFYGYGKASRRVDVFDGDGECFLAIRKVYNTAGLAKANQRLGSKFNVIRNALLDPASVADRLGIDAHSSAQVFAARKMIKAAIFRIERSRDTIYMLDCYFNKMTANRDSFSASSISVKNQMLMEADPVQKLRASNPTTLECVLAHVYFKEPKAEWTTSSGGISRTEVLGPTREKARASYQRELTGLWNNPDTKFIIEGLAAIIRKEKAEIFFSNFSSGVGSLGLPYRAMSSLLGGTVGFYALHHTIIMSSLINPVGSTVQKSVLGSFVHEAQHFLFNIIIHNACSPVRANSPEESLLDDVLKLDRAHRNHYQCQNWQQERVCETFIKLLEKDGEYFPPSGFNPVNPTHLHTMRLEAIVRIAEQLAEGISHDNIKAVAPNLYDYFFRYAKPLIEQFIYDNPVRAEGSYCILQ